MGQRKDGRQVRLTEKQRYWLEHIETAEREGLSPGAYAERHGLRTSQLYYWRSTLRKRGVLATQDVPVELVPVRVRDTRSEVRVHLPNGIVVACSEPLSEAAWLSVLRGASQLP